MEEMKNIQEIAASLMAHQTRRVLVEGFPNAGKSTLAKALLTQMPGATVIHLDGHTLDKGHRPTDASYSEIINCDSLKRSVVDAASSIAIIDGICAREVMRRCNISFDKSIYVVRVSRPNLCHDIDGLYDNGSTSAARRLIASCPCTTAFRIEKCPKRGTLCRGW